MKVSKLIELLKKENQDAEAIAYLGAKDGWEMVELGLGDAILGRQRTDKEEFVLIPVKVPDKLQPWGNAKSTES
tara:strand:+ start:283 stop:504 length:222 start_codon:yes stop_codon:yes gene_type:complete